PIEIVTLGLFTFVINAFLVMVTSAIVPGFHITNFWWALAFSLILWLVNMILHHFEPSKKRHNREHI
ncbi:MAG: phage holin family protein, partial [Patescibacteria group bacterium]